MRNIARAAGVAAVTLAAAVATTGPASAAQFYPAPGFASGNASCVGSALTFGAHYGTDGSSFPQIEHGSVGPAVSGHATSDGPGAVGAFNSALAQQHGSILVCLP